MDECPANCTGSSQDIFVEQKTAKEEHYVLFKLLYRRKLQLTLPMYSLPLTLQDVFPAV